MCKYTISFWNGNVFFGKITSTIDEMWKTELIIRIIITSHTYRLKRPCWWTEKLMRIIKPNNAHYRGHLCALRKQIMRIIRKGYMQSQRIKLSNVKKMEKGFRLDLSSESIHLIKWVDSIDCLSQLNFSGVFSRVKYFPWNTRIILADVGLLSYEGCLSKVKTGALVMRCLSTVGTIALLF